jgi:hypothetical protein
MPGHFEESICGEMHSITFLACGCAVLNDDAGDALVSVCERRMLHEGIQLEDAIELVASCMESVARTMPVCVN